MFVELSIVEIISVDVASGMNYLHEKNIVKFDHKLHNLLVNMKGFQKPTSKEKKLMIILMFGT